MLGLFASVGFERLKVHPGCFQTSISAYYYTPVHGFFVGALVGIGTCLVCLKGNTPTEDILLNLAGMLAPVVALVPTPNTGSCSSVLGTTGDNHVNVANNIFALLAVGFLGLLLLAFMVRRNRPAKPALIGYVVAAAVWLVALLVYVLARAFFDGNAHYAAAILMFACILAVVVVNAMDLKAKTGRRLKNRYSAIAFAMVVAIVVCVITLAAGWAYWIITLEVSLISLFAIFWATQTAELWHKGLR